LGFNPLFDALKKHALHDYNLVLSLDPKNPKYPDWVIIISFYMALHAVNAHAAQAGWNWSKYSKGDPYKISRHSQTLRYVSKQLGKDVFKKYNRLYQECWNARYDPFFLKNITPSEASILFELGEDVLSILP